jgi:hypothetical protein
MCPKHNGVRSERYKLIQIYEFGEWEFYDLEKDPDELVNLYEVDSYQGEIAKMKAELERLRVLYKDETVTGIRDEKWREKYRKFK